MLFNTFEFFLFFAIVYALYLSLQHRWQNRMLLVASYFFYACWDWRFLSLIIFSTVVDYFCGIAIDRSENKSSRRFYLGISIFTNLGLLGFFKYFDFFMDGLGRILSVVGLSTQLPALAIILPVGISFYTFQTMSYTLDIYRKQLKPTRHFFDFALYVAYFPQLVAGPIERARRLLPQVLKERHISLDDFYRGCFLIYWGLFQKVVVADNLAKIVDFVFGNSISNGPLVLVAIYAFAFQIYCDFAGYSNIAIGVSRCMGFDIMTNFRLPYFSKTPNEFWQRWHISLSTWLRDYLYIPLGGNRKGLFKTYRNLMITMILGGLWHGAHYTFLIWGAFHGFLLIAYRFLGNIWLKRKELNPSRFVGILQRIFFFHLVCVGWLFFRAQWMSQVKEFSIGLFNGWGSPHPMAFPFFCSFLLFTIPLWIIEYFQYRSGNLMFFYNQKFPVRFTFYFITGLLLFAFGASSERFIYFQF